MTSLGASSEIAFNCAAVTVRFGATIAVRNLDLAVRCGQITGLVGPNGAGKTTTLRLAVGLVFPHRGSVTVFGLDPTKEPVRVRRQLGYLPDRPALPAHLAVAELLALRGALYGLSRDVVARRIDELSADLDLGTLLHRWCRVLSHGQAQRVALAATLLPRPPLVLVDEPMTALDLEAQHRVQAALRRLADHAAVVVTTHTVAHVAALADRVVQLREGRVVGERSGTHDPQELEAWLLASFC